MVTLTKRQIEAILDTIAFAASEGQGKVDKATAELLINEYVVAPGEPSLLFNVYEWWRTWFWAFTE